MLFLIETKVSRVDTYSCQIISKMVHCTMEQAWDPDSEFLYFAHLCASSFS